MPKIKMIMSEMGADCHDDGRTHGVKHYEAGVEYDVGARLANDFCVRMEVAKYVEPISEKKSLKGAPENKAK